MGIDKLMETGYYLRSYCVYMRREMEGVDISSQIIPDS